MRPETPSAHLTAEDLGRFLTGGLAGADHDRVAAHLESCAECRATVARPAGPGAPDGAAAPSTEAEAKPGEDGRPPTVPQDEPATVHEDPFGDRLPCKFGRYWVQRRLGRGGMGAVYLARDTTLDRPVAVKVSRFRAGEGAAGERFLREARAAADVRHDGVCRVLDCGVIDGAHYITMDYVEGASLAQALADGRPHDARRAALVVREVAVALAAIHQRGIVHRDLKPANIMLRTDGRPCVVDFGLARREQDQTITRAGTLVGTPAYMSPEQVSGEPVTQATDIYSLGVILYQLLAARLPFRGDNLAQLTYQIVYGPVTPPSRHRPEIDPALEAICLRAMARPAGERYPTTAALVEALDGYLRGSHPAPATGAGRPTPPPRGGRLTRLRAAARGRWLPVSGALLLAAGLAAWLLLPPLRARWGQGATDVPPGEGAVPGVEAGPPTGAGQAPPAGGQIEPLPSRGLAISINKYLFANPIGYGATGPNAADVRTALDRLTRRGGRDAPAGEVGVLSDSAGSEARQPTESAIRGAVFDFLKSSRPRDCVILLIVGHVIEIGGEPTLIPIDGATDAKAGAIPLKWIYDQLAGCAGRQKVLVLDTCRLNPSRGLERVGSGPMGAKLDAMLKEPPPGVQVWSSCVAGQFSYEFEGDEVSGGLFLRALCENAGGVLEKVTGPDEPLPLEALKEAVNARMKAVLGPLGKVQTSRLSATEPAAWAGRAADLAVVRTILNDISFPPLKVAADQKPLTAEEMPPFPAAVLEEYMKPGEPTPLRAEVLKARDLFRGMADRLTLNERYLAGDAATLKAVARRDQKELAKLIAELVDVSEGLKAAAEFRQRETKRWQATYDYAVAHLDAQVAYLNEYEAVLGQIVKGLAPPDPKLYKGWRVASQYDPQTGDSVAKKMALESRKKFDKIIAAYPDTPWAALARRDKASGLGLEWQPAK